MYKIPNKNMYVCMYVCMYNDKSAISYVITNSMYEFSGHSSDNGYLCPVDLTHPN